MKSYQILTSRTRYVVPFVWPMEQPFEEICRKIDEQRDELYVLGGFPGEQINPASKWVRKSLKEGEQDIYSHLVEEFSLPGEVDFSHPVEKTGCFWGLELPKKNPVRFLVTGEGDYKKEITLSQVGLYVFQSGIGLLWYEIDPGETPFADSEELIFFQNRFKELNRSFKLQILARADKYRLPAGMEGQEYFPLTIGDWIAERLAFLGVTFQTARENTLGTLLASHYFSDLKGDAKASKRQELKNLLPQYVPDKALLFNYVVFDRPSEWEMDDDALEVVYELTNGYKQSYEMDASIANEVKQPFANVLWMAGREGCGYYAWQGERNENFFTGLMAKKIMWDYFLLYLRGVYQSYSLMKYAMATAEIPNELSLYLEAKEENGLLSTGISALDTSINLFLVKSIVTSVSHIQHQNDFYAYLCERLQIKEDVASVTEGLAALNDLQNRNMEKVRQKHRDEEEDREKEADNSFQMGLGLVTFLAFVSAITDGYAFILTIGNDAVSQGRLIACIVGGVFIFAILVVAIVIFIKAGVNLSRKKRKNKRNKKDGKKVDKKDGN